MPRDGKNTESDGTCCGSFLTGCYCAITLLLVGVGYVALNAMRLTPPGRAVPLPYSGHHDAKYDRALIKLLDCLKRKEVIPDWINTESEMEKHVKQKLVDAAGFWGSNGVRPPLKILDNVVACASEGKDNTECCRSKGVAARCLPFCDGTIPVSTSAASIDLSGLQRCGEKNLGQVVTCHVENLDV